MPQKYLNDIRAYRADVNEQAVASIVKHLGIALKSPDASMVSCSSCSELARVRDSWLKKKLGVTAEDAVLDKAILEVCKAMKGDGKKSRVTVYYLLAEKLGKMSVLTGSK
jgi:hypothetical protein